MFKRFLVNLCLALVVGLFVMPPQLLAESMSSTSYKVQVDDLNVGGSTSTSTSFAADDSLGGLGTGEDLTSTSFKSCVGYQCFLQTPYISFSVKQGTVSPGAAGVEVALGTLTTSSVKTSDGSTINSVFVTAETNAHNGLVVTVRDANNGLKRISTADTIASANATLVAGTAGFGICVFSSTQNSDSPTNFTASGTYTPGSCTKTSGHAVGAVSTSPQTIFSSSGAIKGGDSEILVKAAISSVTAAGTDYSDTLTFVATGTY